MLQNGMKEMKEQREREEKSFNRAMEGLGLMNHNLTNGGKNIVKEIGTNDIGDDDNNNNTNTHNTNTNTNTNVNTNARCGLLHKDSLCQMTIT